MIMQNLINKCGLLALMTLFLGLIPIAEGMAENLEPPQLVIQDVSEQLRQKFQNKAFTSNFAHVTEFVDGVIRPHTDFDVIAPLVLGKHWKTATPEERDRFKNEFRTLLVRSYSRAFVEYNNWSIRYLPLDAASTSKKLIVKTEILQAGQKPVGVDYRMFFKGSWKVYDIIIEGVSLVTNYRTTFSEDIQRKGSLSAVIDGLAKRNAEALSTKGS